MLSKWKAALDKVTSAVQESDRKVVEAIDTGDDEALSNLLSSGASCNGGTHAAATPLCLACSRRQQYCVITLLQAPGIDVNLTKGTHLPPLIVACQQNDIPVVKALLEAGADMHLQGGPSGTTAMMEAASHTSPTTLSLLLDRRADVNQADGNGKSPLWVACHKGNTEVVNLLVNGGARLNDPHKETGTPPLSVAAYFGHTELTALLVEARSNVNQANRRGYTPLHIAASRNHMDVVKVLMECPRTDMELCTSETPLQLAESHGNPQLAAMLKAAARSRRQHDTRRLVDHLPGMSRSSLQSAEKLDDEHLLLQVKDRLLVTRQQAHADVVQKRAIIVLQNFECIANRYLTPPPVVFPVGAEWVRKDPDTAVGGVWHYEILECTTDLTDLPGKGPEEGGDRPSPIVFRIRHRRTQQIYFLRATFPDPDTPPTLSLPREVKTLSTLSHCGVERLLHTFHAREGAFRDFLQPHEGRLPWVTAALGQRCLCTVFATRHTTTLASVVEKDGPLPENTALYYGLQLMQVVDYLTEQRVLHTHLCCEEVYVEDGRVVVGGFRHASLLEDASGELIANASWLPFISKAVENWPVSSAPEWAELTQEDRSPKDLASAALKGMVHTVGRWLHAMATRDLTSRLSVPFPRVDQKIYSRLMQDTIDALSSPAPVRPSSRMSVPLIQWMVYVPDADRRYVSSEDAQAWLNARRGEVADELSTVEGVDVRKTLEVDFLLTCNPTLLYRLSDRFK